MKSLLSQLMMDEAGFIVSAELVLIATILVLSMIVGLSEIANGINQELEDVASAFNQVNQSYHFAGFEGHKGWVDGRQFSDNVDYFDGEFDISCDGGARPEGDY
jgi:Flp pilus assembly pilin Flp